MTLSPLTSRRGLGALILAALLLSGPVAGGAAGGAPANAPTTAPSGRDVLDRLSAAVFTPQPQRYRMTVQLFKDGAVAGENRLSLHIGDFSDDPLRQPKILLRFDAPRRAAGRIILYENARVWIYFPGTQQPLRVPLREQLLGDADIGAVLNIDYRLQYEPAIVPNTSPEFPDAFQLELKDRNGGAPYDRIVLHTDPKTFLPLHAEYYGTSGKLIKQAYFSDFGMLNERMTYRQVRITAIGNDPGAYTTITYTDADHTTLAPSMFQPNSLANFR